MGSKIEYGVTDSELVLFVREDNECAKEALYKKYQPLIYKEIGKFKKRADFLGIEQADLSQEAMLAFSHAINNFKDEGEAKFITFATICIQRRLSNFVSKYDTNKSKILGASVALDAPIEDNTTSVIDQVEDTRSSDPLNKVLNTESLDEAMKTINEELSANERLALKYDLEGKSVNEISKLMNMNTKQIYNLIHRARNKVKQ